MKLYFLSAYLILHKYIVQIYKIIFKKIYEEKIVIIKL